MAEPNPIHPIAQLTLPDQGLSQEQRLLPGLTSDYVALDERGLEDHFAYLKALSARLRFYTRDDQHADADWSAFFPFEAGQALPWLEERAGQVEPHLALLKVFLDGYQQGPQHKLNLLKQRYLEHYYRNVLKFTKTDAVTERAHLVLTLKKQVPKLLLGPSDRLTAGKRQDNSEILVEPVEQSLINQSRVVEKRAIFRSIRNPGQFKVALVADSADGLGESFDEQQPKWSGFGHEALPKTAVGFALSSPLLQLSEAERRIELQLTLTTKLTDHRVVLAELFRVHLSTLDGWSDEYLADAEIDGSTLNLSVTIPAEEAAIVGYQAQLQGFQLDTPDPVMQLLLNSEVADPLVQRLFAAKIHSVELAVKVNGARNLIIKSDVGRVSPDNDFLPFGPTPQVGSTLSISGDEIFSKRLRQVAIKLDWKSPPMRFSSLYSGYASYVGMPAGVDNTYFTVDAGYRDGDGRGFNVTGLSLFHGTNAGVSHRLSISETATAAPRRPDTKGYARALGQHRSRWAQKQFGAFQRLNPVYQRLGRPIQKDLSQLRVPGSSLRKEPGLQLILQQDFFHQHYRNAYVKNVLALNTDPSLPMISEPYTPQISDLSLDYEAYSQPVSLADSSPQAFANTEIRFFHLDCFGQRREHAYQRQQLDFVNDKAVSLLPQHPEQGALLLGIEQLQPGDSVQLLFQVVDGSADPQIKPSPVRWSVLCDNYWKPLSRQELIFDRSNGLLRSGIVRLLIPPQATTDNSLMPSGLLWLKLAVDEHPQSLCLLRDIRSNAIEVVVLPRTPSNQASSFDPLPAGAITKFNTARTEIKSVEQPYEGFGGRPRETDERFAARVSERLRHKDRALSLRDYETLVLERFDRLYRVKAIPHTRPTADSANWQAPGHTCVLLLPYVQSENAVDPLRPLVDSQTLDEVQSFLDTRKPMQVQVHVRNPSYLQVRMSLAVRFRQGYEFNHYQQQLQRAIRNRLSPWLDEQQRGPLFGGQIYKSVLTDFIEGLPYVEFITEVQLQSSSDGELYSDDSHRIEPKNALQILTSAPSHRIEEAADD
ncbi:baseplate J/gp47 family protein [Motiliproteus sp.]|uniref:baseplate J/gp47 family protein n=1 Tax=Motiliproteus sp. TaxID=1898955 RepID=UPI003BAA8781